MNLTTAEIAYTAGIVDGEGSISITKSGTKGRDYYSVVVCVANTDMNLLVWLRDKFGGAILPRHTRNNAHRPAYTLQLAISNATVLLEAILPYLIVKKERAYVAMEFIHHRHHYSKRGRGGGPAWLKEIEASLYERMKQLNARGPVTDY